MTITGHAGTDLTLDKTSLTFTTTNWATAQTVTVTADPDDDAVDDEETLTHTASGGGYTSVTEDLPVTVDDTYTAPVVINGAALVLSPASLGLTEGGSTNYSVALAALPTAEVTVTITGHVGTDLTLDETSLTFTTSNWSTAQTVRVTAGEDDDAENDEETLTHTASGGGYSSVTESVAEDLDVTVTDDDEPGLDLSKTSLGPAEGSSESYTVALETQPTAQVRVAITGQAETDLTLNKTSLTFTTTNWASAQTVRVTADTDDDAEDDEEMLTHTASGGGYGSVAKDLPVTVKDNDEPGQELVCNMFMEPVTVHEGETAEFTIVIDPPLPRDDILLWWVHPHGEASTPEDIPSAGGKAHLNVGATEVRGTVETYTDEETEPTEGFQIVMDWVSWRVPPDPKDWRLMPSCTGRIYIRDGESNGVPVFANGERTTRKVAENRASGRPVGKPVTAEDPNDDPVTYTLEGPDAALFSIDTGTGQLHTARVLDYESKAAYEVTVRADDDWGGKATIAVTVNVVDEREKPATPDAPTVVGSGRSLLVSWSAPENTGPPMKYDLKYREKGRGQRTDAPSNVTGLSVTLGGLEADTEYEVQVLAHNDEGSSRFSEWAYGRTGTNDPPVFDEGPRTTRSVAENTASGQPVGDAVTANDPEGDELTYTLEGPDAGSFRIDSGTGRLSTHAALDYESKASHTLTVKADDGEGGTATIGVTVNVTDVDEPPLAVSIADAMVEEGRGAVLAFAVTLDRAAQAMATVDWETRDGSATAGDDYVAGSGTLRFSPGETAKTIRVAVLDDSHDEGLEVMLAVLSNPVGATIAKAAGRGTIDNTDPMPQAWLGRFGRAASDHVVEAISDRWRDGERETPQTHFRLGGREVDKLFGGRDGTGGMFESSGAGQGNPALEYESAWARMDRLKAEALGPAGGSLAGGNPVGSSLTDAGSGGPGPAGSGLGGEGVAGRNPAGGGSSGGDARSALMSSLGLPSGNLRDVLMGSSFFYSRPLDEDGRAKGPGWLGQLSAWGRAAATRLSGADGELSLNGEVATAILGMDSRWDRWLAGVTLSQSMGEGAYTHPTATGGAVSSTLTSLNPYVHHRLNERTSLWGVAGYGVGGLKLTLDGVETGIETDLATAMAGFGGRRVFLVRSSRLGAFELAVVSDVRVSETESSSVENLMGAAGATSRVRVMLEGTGSIPLATGGVLTPTLEAGLRNDTGDAETGAGLELGGGLGYAAGSLSAQIDARRLVAHEDTEYEEWGLGGSIAYTASQDGRGLSMSLGSGWGTTQSGVQSLWNRPHTSGLARHGAFDAAQRYEAELRYGLAGRKGRARRAPYIGVEWGEGSGRALRLGVKLGSALANAGRLEAGLELGRRQERASSAPEHAVMLRGKLRW